MVKQESGEKTNLYLLAIVGIVAVVGIVVLVLNSSGTGSVSFSSDDLSGQVLKVGIGKTTLDVSNMKTTDAIATVLSGKDGDCCQKCKEVTSLVYECYCTC